MTWGPYWMFYRCPSCGKKFKQSLDDIGNEAFGTCPSCESPATLDGESKAMPTDAQDYEMV